jgi:hypothetical protein
VIGQLGIFTIFCFIVVNIFASPSKTHNDM